MNTHETRHKVDVARYFPDKNGDRHSLDINFVNTMTVVASPYSINEFLGDHKNWVAFHNNGRFIYRRIRSSRSIDNSFQKLCVDHNFMHVLDLEEGQAVQWQPIAWHDYLNLRVWILSLTPALRIAFWFTLGGAVLGAFVGTLFAEVVTFIFHR